MRQWINSKIFPLLNYLKFYSNLSFGSLYIQEKLILRKLKFRLNAPTHYVFLVRFLKAGQSNKKVCNSACMVVQI